MSLSLASKTDDSPMPARFNQRPSSIYIQNNEVAKDGLAENSPAVTTVTGRLTGNISTFEENVMRTSPLPLKHAIYAENN